MNFHFADEKLKNVELLFRRIADQYLAMLNSSFLFRAKLDAVEVHADSRMGLDDFQGRLMDLELTVPNLQQARKIEAAYRRNADTVYQSVMIGLLEEAEQEDTEN